MGRRISVVHLHNGIAPHASFMCLHLLGTAEWSMVLMFYFEVGANHVTMVASCNCDSIPVVMCHSTQPSSLTVRLPNILLLLVFLKASCPIIFLIIWTCFSHTDKKAWSQSDNLETICTCQDYETNMCFLIYPIVKITFTMEGMQHVVYQQLTPVNMSALILSWWEWHWFRRGCRFMPVTFSPLCRTKRGLNSHNCITAATKRK